MLDNKDNQFNLDDQFADQAWTNMRDMLDQEMPVVTTAPSKRRKKPYALLLLLWLVGFGAGVSTILLWQQKSESTSPSEQVPDIPIADLQQASGQAVLPEREADDQSLAERQSSKISTPATVKRKVIDRKTNTRSALASNYSTNNIVSIKNSSSDKNSTLTNKSNDSASILTSVQNKTKPINSLALDSKQLNAFEKFSLKPLAIVSTGFEGFEEEENKTISKLLIPSLKKIKINWGLMSGLHSEPSRGYGGYSVGLIVDAEVDRKFGFASGLMFSRFQFNDIMLNNSPDAFNLNQNNNGGVYNDVTEVPFETRSTDISSNAVRLGSANFISIPLMLTYKTSRRLQVNMGVEYARMLRASSNKFNGPNNQDFTSTYKWYDSSSYGDLLGKTNFSALFGLSLQPNEQFGFDVRYNHGFSDLSKNKGQFSAQSDTRESLQFH